MNDKPYYYERTYSGISVRMKDGNVLMRHYSMGEGFKSFQHFVDVINDHYYNGQIDTSYRQNRHGMKNSP